MGMSEVVKRLALSNGIYDCITDPYDKLDNGDPYSSVMVDLERFAELIVRECIQVVDDTQTSNQEMNIGLVMASAAIISHFGVEE